MQKLGIMRKRQTIMAATIFGKLQYWVNLHMLTQQVYWLQRPGDHCWALHFLMYVLESKE